MAFTLQSGTIATVAGCGEPGFAGDGGPAIAARLSEPKSLAVSGQTLYIADSENHVVRRVDLSTGVIRTVAGRAADQPTHALEPAPSPWEEPEDPLGDAVPVTRQKVLQQGDLSGTVRYLVGTAPKDGRCEGDGGSALAATLNFPSAVAVDRQGHVYIADMMNHRVRKVDVETGLITTVAGGAPSRSLGDGAPATSAKLHDPCALVLDGEGKLYIADQSHNRIRRVDLTTGLITTVAGTGEAAYDGDGKPATEASLAGPSGLALSEDGLLYVADTFNGRIRSIDLATGLIATVAGDGSEYRYQGVPGEFSTSLSRPYGIAVTREGDLLITDSDSHLIRVWHRKKKVITLLAGNGQPRYDGDGGPAKACSLNYPFGVAVGDKGQVYIADTFNHRIRMIAA